MLEKSYEVFDPACLWDTILAQKVFFLRLRLSYDTLNSNFISEGYNLKAKTQFNLFYSGRQSAKEDKLYVDLVSNFYTGANPLKQKAILALQEEFVQHINQTVDKSQNKENSYMGPKLGKRDFLATSVPHYLRLGVLRFFPRIIKLFILYIQ